MLKIPARDKKEAVLSVLKYKKSVTEVARKYNVSRKCIYSWVKLYKEANSRAKPLALKLKYRSGRLNRNTKYLAVKYRLIQLITSHPDWGVRRYSAVLSKEKNSLSINRIYYLLKSLDAETPAKRLIFKNIYGGVGRLNHSVRAEVAGKVESGMIKASYAAKKFGIARKTIYSWINKTKTGKSLKDSYLTGKDHPGAIYPKIEKDLLTKVVQNPGLSVHKLKESVPASSWTIWKILDRNNLNTIAKRLAYSELQISIGIEKASDISVDRQKSVFDTFTPNLAPAPPPFAKPFTFKKLLKPFSVSAFLSFIVGTGLIFWYRLLFVNSAGPGESLGLIFASMALLMGGIFFLYSFKYYITLAVVLSYSQDGSTKRGKRLGVKDLIAGILGVAADDSQRGVVNSRVGLEADLSGVKLLKKPFISIQIPFYNEKNVVERAIRAATNFKYEGDYEVILCDDSTDETSQIIRNYQIDCLFKNEKLHEVKGDGWTLNSVEVKPGVTLKHLHRTTRQGYKGAALKLALTLIDPRSEFISVFDADFVPYPDTLELFLKYFQLSDSKFQGSSSSNIAAVQGYQWHVLNKSENWITRGVRSEYAGSYVVERSGAEIYGGLKQISGSVYMIKRKPLEEVGWGSSITEDFELTLKLYEKGYKVLYTPYIQAPAECVSTVKRLIKQRMRWAEGHSFNVKKLFKHLLLSPLLSYAEKLELLYLTPYYLQAFLFILGTFSWILAETVFKVRLPFWTELWGWSLVLTNMFALPLMNSVGLFVEESEEKDYAGLASFVALSYLLVPFQAYAAVKGLIEKEEGPWFRTPKTGRITDLFSRGKFYRFIEGFLPGLGRKDGTGSLVSSSAKRYLALNTANSRFDQFSVSKKSKKWFGKAFLSVLIIISLLLNNLAFFSDTAKAAAPDPTIEQQINIIDQVYTLTSTTPVPTDNSLGLITWDGTKYTGATIYYEAVMTCVNCSGGNARSLSQLYDSAGNAVTGATATAPTGSVVTRSRSASITLTNGTDYTVRAKCDATSCAQVQVRAARIIVIQSSSSGIAKTVTQIEVGLSGSTMQTTLTAPSAPNYYKYDNDLFSDTKNVYFEATLKSGLATTNTGIKTPSASTNCVEDSSIGTAVWTSPGNAFSDNGTYASVSVDGTTSRYIKCTNFGFSLPSNATVKGVIVGVERKSNSNGNGGSQDAAMRIVKGGTIGTTDMSTTTIYPQSDTFEDHGSTSELWGETWTYSDINASTFGAAFAVKKASGAGAAHSITVDTMRITVYYEAPTTVTADLYNVSNGASVTNSEVTLTNTSWTRVRSASALTTNWDTVSDDQYVIRFKTSSGNSYIANAKIIIEQSSGSALTALQVAHLYSTLDYTNSDLGQYEPGFNYNSMDKSNWYGGTFAAYFEATIKTDSGGDYQARLDYGGGIGLVTGNQTSYTLTRSSDIWSSLPATATNVDVEMNNSTVGHFTWISSSWLLINVSNLQVPENIILFLPIALLVPVILSKRKKWYFAGLSRNILHDNNDPVLNDINKIRRSIKIRLRRL